MEDPTLCYIKDVTMLIFLNKESYTSSLEKRVPHNRRETFPSKTDLSFWSYVSETTQEDPFLKSISTLWGSSHWKRCWVVSTVSGAI